MYYIAICDDDIRYINYIEELLVRRVGMDPYVTKIYKYTSGEELVKYLDTNIPFNLLILDMKMKQLDGDDTARAFRRKYPNTLLVFCSGECQPTVKSFEANAFRYLLKQYDSDKMTSKLGIVIEEMEKRAEEPQIPISYRDETIMVNTEDILYVSIRKYGSNVYTYDNDSQTTIHLISNKTISELYNQLESFNFAYAHKSYIVNFHYIAHISQSEIELHDGTILTISRSKEKRFRKGLALYLASKY